MAVSVVGGPQRRRGGGDNVSRQTFTQSTATADQLINLFADQVTLGVGTATGFVRNRYTLATGAEEGKEIVIFVTGTGETYTYLGGGTATGRIKLDHTDDWLLARYWFGRWWILAATPDTAGGHTAPPLASST